MTIEELEIPISDIYKAHRLIKSVIKKTPIHKL